MQFSLKSFLSLYIENALSSRKACSPKTDDNNNLSRLAPLNTEQTIINGADYKFNGGAYVAYSGWLQFDEMRKLYDLMIALAIETFPLLGKHVQ